MKGKRDYTREGDSRNSVTRLFTTDGLAGDIGSRLWMHRVTAWMPGFLGIETRVAMEDRSGAR